MMHCDGMFDEIKFGVKVDPVDFPFPHFILMVQECVTLPTLQGAFNRSLWCSDSVL